MELHVPLLDHSQSLACMGDRGRPDVQAGLGDEKYLKRKVVSGDMKLSVFAEQGLAAVSRAQQGCKEQLPHSAGPQ